MGQLSAHLQNVSFKKIYNAHHPMMVFMITVVIFVTESPFTLSMVANSENVGSLILSGL
jgi:hypothetical protein